MVVAAAGGQAPGLTLRKQRVTTWVSLGLVTSACAVALAVDLARVSTRASGPAGVVAVVLAGAVTAAVLAIGAALLRSQLGGPQLVADGRGVTVRPGLAGRVFNGWSSIAEILVCYVQYGTGARPVLFIRHRPQTATTHERVGWLAARSLARADRASGGRCGRFHLALDLRWFATSPEDVADTLREMAPPEVLVIERDFTRVKSRPPR